MPMNVAIDGPAGAGKSTIAKEVSRRLSCIYVDTGAMYRAMALYLIREHAAMDSSEDIEQKCQNADISIRFEDDAQQVILNGENVTGLLRTEEVGNMASMSSVNPKVREKLVALQQELAKREDVVMDGRDIGTMVLPDANVKIYLTASVDTRAGRRFRELTEKGMSCDLEKIKEDIRERDERDMNREISPLKQAEDAVLVDSSQMTIEEVVQKILQLCEEKKDLIK